jgi:hypothetical protein
MQQTHQATLRTGPTKSYGCKRFQQELLMNASLLRVSIRASRVILLIAAMGAMASFVAAQNRDVPGSVAMEPKSRKESTEASPAETTPTATTVAGKAKGTDRLREGTRLIDVIGAFQSVGGDSVSFSPGGNKDSFRVLENLALERVSRTLDENRGTRQWVVSGTITEYRGSNYLLLTKAVVQLHEGDAAAGQ